MEKREPAKPNRRKGVQSIARRVVSCAVSAVLAAGLVPAAAFAAVGDQGLAAAEPQTQEVAFVQLNDVERAGGADFALAADADSGEVDGAADGQTVESLAAYADDDIVRVSIELEGKGVLDAGYSAESLATSFVAKAYREGLERHQQSEVAAIEEAIEGAVEVKQNLTLAADVVSAEVAFGDIAAIQAVPGVKGVYIENRYEAPQAEVEEVADPSMATSSAQIGSGAAYAAGYTGAGSRIAVIDTGIDTDHQSFSAEGLAYSLKQNAKRAGVTESSYVKSLNLLDEGQIEAVKSQLHLEANVTAADLYINEKIAYGYNYIDEDLDVTHDNDSQGEHGSHVEGIAAANAYIPADDGSFVSALDTVGVQGVAPDAQIIAMKVFGKAGGAYDSDYMVAIEDAVVLGADSINLSLGSAMAGSTKASDLYQGLFDTLTEHGAVVAIAAGNAYNWSYRTKTPGGKLYADETNFDTVGSPGSYTNSLAVASATNIGRTGTKFSVGNADVYYTETSYSNEPLSTIAGKYDFVMIPGDGSDADFAAVADQLKGKVAFCGIGTNAFAAKAEAAVKYGAIATVVYNNLDGNTYRLGLSAYTKTQPVVSISRVDWQRILDNAVEIAGDDGKVQYWTGKIQIDGSQTRVDRVSESTSMSVFSSWGPTGDLALKPEVTAPGGNIYSVNGSVEGGKAYETMSGTSMATPQIAGMTAVIAQYIRENNLVQKTGKSARQLAQSLLMSTAEPLLDPATDGRYYPVIEQGAGLANVGNAVSATSFLTVAEGATPSASDGKVKVELGQDKQRTGSYGFTFGITNMSDHDASYTLSGDLFTQAITDEDGVSFLDVGTEPVAADLSFNVNGVVYRPEAAVVCDLNADGATDAADAQAILDYASGIEESIDSNADVDGDGAVTTHDAQAILSNMQTQQVTVAAGTTLYVDVSMVLTDQAKANLDAAYANGAYIEGYVFANPTVDEQGILSDVTHSIPVSGFFGAWDEASMYDASSVVDRLYGDARDTHFGVLNSAKYNGLTINRGTGNRIYDVTGNPYAVESEYPADRVAINGADSLYYYRNIVVRNAAARMAVVTNQDGEVIYTGELQNDLYGAFYHSFYGWVIQDTNYTINRTPRSMGAKEGDVLTVQMVTVPESYGLDGPVTSEQLLEWAHNGELGRGCYLTTTLRVDNTAPTVSFVSKDLNTGNYLVTAKDNQYIAAVRIANRTGSRTYKTIVPDQEREGDSVTVDLGDLSTINLPNYWSVIVCDYAGNETAYQLVTDPSIDVSVGELHAFTNAALTGEGSGNRFVTIDPDGVWYSNSAAGRHGGFELAGNVPAAMTAAEYVGGYVYMVGADNHFYVARQGDFENALDGGYIGDGVGHIRDLSYNYADNTLYALGQTETYGVSAQYDGETQVYKVDLGTCKLTQVATIKAKLSVAADGYETNENTQHHLCELINMAIDKKGTFWAVSYGLYSHPYDNSYLYKFSLDEADENGVIEPAPVVNTTDGNLTVWSQDAYNGSMAWDHDDDRLFWSNGSGSSYSSTSCYLYEIDTQTGKAYRTNTTNAGTYAAATYGSRLPNAVTGLYVVPRNAEPLSISASEATEVSLDQTELNLLAGSSTSLAATVLPWCLSDMSVTWESSDESVVNVSANGGVYAAGAGTATITVTPTANPNIHATCTVNVRPVTPMNLTALATERAQTDEGTGKVKWVDFSTADLNTVTTVRDSDHAYIGASEGLTTDGPKIVAHAQETGADGKTSDDMYLVDPDTFKSTKVGATPANWTESEVAPMQIDAEGDEIFGFYLLPYLNGTVPRMKIMNTDGSQRGDVTLSGNYTVPVVAIAYAGYDPEYTWNVNASMVRTAPTEKFYYLLADGRIIQWNYYLYQKSRDSYLVNSTGAAISTPDIVSDNLYKSDGSNDISMIWNEADQALLISFTEEGTTKFFEVDPETGLYTTIGTLGGDVEKVTDLYQYERVTDQVVWITSKVHEVFEKEQIQLSARVLPERFADKVVWSSSDEKIAVVDPDTGVVTGTGDGDVTITATSADADDNGEHATATVDVHVTGLARVPGVTLRGQVTQTVPGAEEGAEPETATSWASINAGEVSDGLSAPTATETSLYGGGILADGKFYGTDAAYTQATPAPEVTLYQVDPATGEAVKGGSLAADQGFQAAASVPAATYSVTDADGNQKEVAAFGNDFALTRATSNNLARNLYVIDDWKTGALTRIGTLANPTAGFLGAATGLQYYQTVYGDDGVPTAYFLVGYYTGGAYMYSVTPKYDAATDTVSYTFANAANGVAFYLGGTVVGTSSSASGPQPFVYVKNANAEGIIFGRFADGDTTLYWLDFNKSQNADVPKPVPGMTGANRPTYVAQKMGVLKGVTDLQGLYVSADTNPQASDEPATPEALKFVRDILDGAVNVVTGSTQALAAGDLVVEPAAESGQAADPEPSASDGASSAVAQDGTVTVTLADTAAAANGLIKVSYDPKAITYEAAQAPVLHSVLSDPDTGQLTFAFADVDEIAAGEAIAQLTFAYATESIDTQIKVTVEQRNADVALSEQTTIDVRDEASKQAEADQAAAQAVEDAIAALPDPEAATAADVEAAQAAQDALDVLTDEQKALVGEAAKAKLAAVAEAAAAAKAADEQKSAEDVEKAAANKAAAQAVEEAIAALPAADQASADDEAAVKAAQAAFDALTSAQKVLVSADAKDKLLDTRIAVSAAVKAAAEAAEEAEREAAAAQAKADAINAVRDAIDAIGVVSNTPESAALIKSAQDALAQLKAVYPDAVVPNASTLDNVAAQLKALQDAAKQDASSGQGAGSSSNGGSGSNAGSTTAKPSAPKVVKGKSYKVKGLTYKVTKVASGKAAGTVTLAKAKNAKKVTVPAAVKLADGKSYKVTAIGAKSFKNLKKLQTVVIGKNVKKIAKSAFFKTPKLKQITVKSKLLKKKASVKASLKGSKAKKLTVKVPKASKKTYKKVFTKANLKAPKKVTVK